MEKWMNETLEMCFQSILSDTPNVISSPGSVAGATLSDSQDGPTTVPALREVLLASLSARQAKERGLMTSGTYGPRSSISLSSDILQLYLENKLPARLDSRGSTLFKLTWKRRATPQQRSIFALRASGLHTSVSVYSGVPTPDTGMNLTDANWEQRRAECKAKWGQNGFGLTLGMAASLAAVPSPCTPNGGRSMSIEKMDATGKTLDGRKHTASLEHVVKFSSAPTPTLHDSDRGGRAKRAMGESRHGSNLQDFALLSSTATPAARDYKSNSSTEEFQLQQWNHPRGKPLSAQATLADSGEAATGGTAATKSSGQLNPEYSRWLQGYPNEWGSCADMVILSSRRSRRNL
jgi:hypothetical protein